MSQFKLIAEKMNPRQEKSTRKEKHGVLDVLNYLDSLLRQRVPIDYWVNEENPGIRGRSHPRRKRASDIIGIAEPHGRWVCIEMKREKEYAHIIGHWEQLKKNAHNQCDRYEHYRDQIEFIERIENRGGIGLFAWKWQQVRDRLIKEGIDPGTMIYAGGNA